MRAGDLPLLHEWLGRPHVLRWYGDHGTYEEVVEHYLPAIEGRDPTDHYVVLLDGRPVGMIQSYVVSDYPDHAALMGVGGSTVAGVDILLAEEALTGKGLGTRVLRQFVAEVVFARTETTSCIADPAAGNLASVRAFEKAGFRIVGEHVDPADGLVHVLVRRDRESSQGAQRVPR